MLNSTIFIDFKFQTWILSTLLLLLAVSVIYTLVKTYFEYRETQERTALMAEDRQYRQEAIQSHASRMNAMNLDLISEIQRRQERLQPQQQRRQQ